MTYICDMTEIWKDIRDFEGFYQVSNLGRVRSVERAVLTSSGHKRNYKSKILSSPKDSVGYHVVTLSRMGETKSFKVHNLVANYFLKPKPAGYEVCHRDGDPSNNAANNLRWGTHKSNMEERSLHGNAGKGIPRRTASPDIVAEVLTRYKPHCSVNGAAALSREFGFALPTIRTWVDGKTKLARSFLPVD